MQNCYPFTAVGVYLKSSVRDVHKNRAFLS